MVGFVRTSHNIPVKFWLLPGQDPKHLRRPEFIKMDTPEHEAFINASTEHSYEKRKKNYPPGIKIVDGFGFLIGSWGLSDDLKFSNTE